MVCLQLSMLYTIYHNMKIKRALHLQPYLRLDLFLSEFESIVPVGLANECNVGWCMDSPGHVTALCDREFRRCFAC